MRSIRIYQPGPYDLGETLTLCESAAQHVSTVLRLTVGASLILFCGDNHEYNAIIVAVRKKTVQVQIEAIHNVNRESPRIIHLAQSLAKGDKMEWIIQKAVELGVTSITPLITDRSVIRLDEERLAKKHMQWEAISIAACEQSGRNHLPKIHPACSMAYFLEHSSAQYKWMLTPQASHTWPTIQDQAADLAILIGPEGGFSHQELELAARYQVQGIGIGPRILRTETAAITALSIVQCLYGDL